MPRIVEIKGMKQWPRPNYSIQEYADLRNAISLYVKALDREVGECKHRWKEVDGKWICTKCNKIS